MWPWYTPMVIACVVVALVYFAKNGDKDPNNRPNYTVVFVASLALAYGLAYVFSSSSVQGGGAIDIVMREIDVGEPDF